MDSYDIAIIGAGPASATLARLIGQKYKVLLIDKRKMDTPYHPGDVNKCCGGLLAPDAQKILARLGLGVPITWKCFSLVIIVLQLACAETLS